MKDCDIEKEMYSKAVDFIIKRYPVGWGGAGVVRTENGHYFISVGMESANAAAILCIETGAILEAHKYKEKVTHCLCLIRDDEKSSFKILTLCGICQERLRFWGESVKVAVTTMDGSLKFVTLNELQPYHWTSAYPTNELEHFVACGIEYNYQKKIPSIEVIEYNESFCDGVKDLLVELQNRLVGFDSRGIMSLNPNYRDGYFEFILQEITKYNGKIFLANKEGAVIGVIVCIVFQLGGTQEFTTNCPLIGLISDLVVTSDEQGKGVGSALIQRAEKYFSECRCNYIQIENLASNVKAFNLYKKLGFDVNCMRMIKRL